MDQFIDQAADVLDQKFGNFDNLANQLGLSQLKDNHIQFLNNHVSPSAARAVDDLFGSAKTILDEDGNGHIEFQEIGSLVKDLVGIKQPPPPPLQQALQLQLQTAAIQMQLQMMAFGVPPYALSVKLRIP